MEERKYYVVRDFTFEELQEDREKITNFEPKSFNDFESRKNNFDANIIRRERADAKKTSFQFFDVVKEYRGQKKQEEQDYEKAVNDEVEKRVSDLKDKAYREGYEAGRKEGITKAENEAQKSFQDQVERLKEIVENAHKERSHLIEDNREEIYRMIRTLVKWVSFKELGDDSYLPKLLEKLILELNQKHNLLVKVSRVDSELMPDVIKQVEENIGNLVNCRVEIENDLKERGIILESERGIIDASIDVQFSKIDKIFESVSSKDD